MILTPRRHWVTSRDNLSYYNWELRCYCGANKHPTVHRAAPPQQRMI